MVYFSNPLKKQQLCGGLKYSDLDLASTMGLKFVNYIHTLLAGSGCPNKITLTGGLQQQNFISHSSGSQEGQD